MNTEKFKQKKKKAITDYKSAITNIGSKAVGNSGKSCFTRPATSKSDGKALVNEKEYNSTDDWLIEDMSRSKSSSSCAKKEPAGFTSGALRNKRKHASNDMDESESNQYDKRVDFDIDDIVPIDLNIGEKPRQNNDFSTSSSRSRNDDDVIHMDESGKTNNKKASRLFSLSSMSKKRILDNDVVSVNHVDKAFSNLPESRKNPSFTDKENLETSN